MRILSIGLVACAACGGGGGGGAGAARCGDGGWRGVADDAHGAHWSWQLALHRAGAGVAGEFTWDSDQGHHGTEDVTGAWDCARGAITLHGATSSGNVEGAAYSLELGAGGAIHGTWTCDEPCANGELSGGAR